MKATKFTAVPIQICLIYDRIKTNSYSSFHDKIDLLHTTKNLYLWENHARNTDGRVCMGFFATNIRYDHLY